VPWLAVYLIWERWRDRPEASEPGVPRGFFFVLLFALGATRLAQEANPDWRLLSWMAALAVAGILIKGFLMAGGAAWGKHFAFAAAFILVAVPWPTPVENVLVQSLMRGVAGVAVEFLNWLGIAAQQEGNLVRLSNGTLGIDEACSGVRSFQATIMVALFLGELRRLGWGRRVGLVAAGVVLALGLNLVRAVLLALLAGKSGIAAVNRWHDPAGWVLLVVTFFGLVGMAWAMAGENEKLESPAVDSYAGDEGVRGGRMVGVSRARGKLESPAVHSYEGYEALGRERLVVGAIFVLIGLAISEVATQTWYRWHERDEFHAAQWRVHWPYGEGNFERAPISEQIQLTLRFNEGETARWDRANGSRWFLYFFHWKPGRAAAALARNHRPETCLPATGFQFAGSRGVKTHHLAGVDLPVERLEFTHGEQRWHVYYCLWEDRVGQAAPDAGLLTRAGRLQAVAEGRRHLGQRTLEVVITGVDSAERADEEFAEALGKWIIVTKS
jgi:exosortase